MEARAAAERAHVLRDADAADAAFALYVGGREGASQSVVSRLFEHVRSVLDRASKRAGSTHEFNVLARPTDGDSGDGGSYEYVFHGEMRAFLADWMASMHALDPDDVRFCPTSLRELTSY